MNDKLNNKFEQIQKLSSWEHLPDKNKAFLMDVIKQYRLTYQQSRHVIDIVLDFENWHESLDILKRPYEHRQRFLETITNRWDELKTLPADYSAFVPDSRKLPDYKMRLADEESIILGRCPVASEKTRCCNLMTLDVVRNCGFDCNYCCIQSYFHDNEIIIEKNLLAKLSLINFDKNQIYHIGTGQSSDSLMWGDQFGHLTDLCVFLKQNPNVILELKTKSNNVADLLKLNFPSNIICTWSLNPQTVIKNEERFTTSLKERLQAARRVADHKMLVGFHFHPMIYYMGWESEYRAVAKEIKNLFDPREVAMISFGTLTYIKPVIKKIRSRLNKTLVLKIPLNEVEGKYSYPREIKRQLFKCLYDEFAAWHQEVFFYMCMEEKDLWRDVFNYEYVNNADFEKSMLDSYLTKIRRRFSLDQ
ncbi:MAG: hypothetical protein A2381_16830 [Bdellovibrionales bacterium RIFOXYB1_FULL_37_110]|nr:MAG: hypothetical protein A2181_07835 [Bdellovibrionales bacterium RIFOXYA1_FULL_38_20]OFZ50063.1 MAG: hypothetical protein A2417_18665 [Bdellovibrionales bacterium RIFOXYC1_FULL_37_79]OFZ59969.1 MAG: hypothetical protein A2381_16830 [Bdellovibrionales bacterium RIFOXYB1_FULL_37_110]OFZ63940.1 MAG: hypothetical protein A2577_06020 [Bdellovibrionales bacterium RIFOXYD1_FULL_36_51]